MNFDFRYHVVTLVAVFMALGIGIIIGSALLGNDALVQQQREMTDRLEQQLEEMRQENKAVQAKIHDLEAEQTIQKQFEKQILPALITDKLAGVSVAIIETNNYGVREELLNTLEISGAEVVSITTVLNGLAIENKEEFLANLGLEEGNEQETVKQLATILANGILTAENQAALNIMAQAEMIKTVGEYGIPLDAVIIVGGSPEKSLIKTQQIDNIIINYFLSNNIPVYGVEESNVAYSYMKEYQKFNISTVDNVETVPGQLALVYAMSGKAGHYGVKSTAQRLLPKMDSSVNQEVNMGE